MTEKKESDEKKGKGVDSEQNDGMERRRNRRVYPDEPVDPEDFDTPPVSFTDKEGREIEIRSYGEGPSEGTFWKLVNMYKEFDPSDRAQGLPPTNEERIRDWLDMVLRGLNLIAWQDERVVGHAMLVPDRDREYELAIFVHQDYQGAGVGSELIECLLGYGAQNGVEKIWLTVERWNRAAVAIYERVGFEHADTETFELEMTLRLE